MRAQGSVVRLRWAIFCHVVDNWGDLGVCWRLACNLAARGQLVRLFVDDSTILPWMAPKGMPGVEVQTWSPAAPLDPAALHTDRIDDVLIEAFGCQVPTDYLEAFALRARQTHHYGAHWLNVEYLSAEPYAEQCHGLPSPVSAGPGAGLRKHFFYPGFVPKTGGLLRERDLAKQRQRFRRSRWLRQQGIDWRGERLVSLFCYEPAALPALLSQLAEGPEPVLMLVCAGRGAQASRRAWPAGPGAKGKLRLKFLPRLSQADFDRLLWACDLNFVRGEDSLVRALWAGKPFVWQAYEQADEAHQVKLAAFLDWLKAPEHLRIFHQAWNNSTSRVDCDLPRLSAGMLKDWSLACRRARRQLLSQKDLATQLIDFVDPGRLR